jgi:hypothetical protein
VAPFAPSVIDRLGDLSRCEGHFAENDGLPFQLPDRFARKSLTTSFVVKVEYPLVPAALNGIGVKPQSFDPV